MARKVLTEKEKRKKERLKQERIKRRQRKLAVDKEREWVDPNTGQVTSPLREKRARKRKVTPNNFRSLKVSTRAPSGKYVDYQKYLSSTAWKRKRFEYWNKGQHKSCVVCGRKWENRTDSSFQLHHVTYDRLGDEDLLDLVPVCGTPCHEYITARWRQIGGRSNREGLTLLDVTEQVRYDFRRSH